MDNLGLVEAIDSFREGIVVTIANTADRRLNALSDIDREYFAGVFTAASAEYNDLANKGTICSTVPDLLDTQATRPAFVYIPCSQGRS